jgi:hypothetical protein
MNRGDAYGILADRLERCRSIAYDALCPFVDHPMASETVRLNDEDVVIDIRVTWQDKRSRSLCISASASGPSTWMTERLAETIVICPDR